MKLIRRFGTIIKPESFKFKRIVSIVFFLLASYCVGVGILKTTYLGYSWKGILINFAPAVFFMGLLILAIFYERNEIDFRDLIRRPTLSFIQILFCTLAGLIGGIIFLYWPISLGFTLTMFALTSMIGFIIAAGFILAGRSDKGTLVFVYSLPFLAFIDDEISWASFSWWNTFRQNLGGFDVFPTIAAVILLFLFWLFSRFLIPQKMSLMKSRINIAVFLYFIVSLISVVFSHNVPKSLVCFLYDQVFPLMVFFVVLNTLLSKESIHKILSALTIATSLITFFGIFFFIRDIAESDFQRLYSARRLYGLIPHSSPVVKGSLNEIAVILSLCIPITLGLLVSDKLRYKRFIWAIVFIFLIFALWATYSLDHWIAISIGLLLYVWLAWGKKNKWLSVYLMVTMIFLFIHLIPAINMRESIGLIYPDPDYINSILGLKIYENWRIIGYKAALGMVRDFPLIGVGIAAFGDVYHNYGPIRLFSPGVNYIPFAHNIYLNVAAERGIPGLLALLLFLGLVLREGFSALKFAIKEEDRYLIIGLLCGLISFILQGLTEGAMLGGSFQYPVYIFYILVACIIQTKKSIEKRLYRTENLQNESI